MRSLIWFLAMRILTWDSDWHFWLGLLGSFLFVTLDVCDCLSRFVRNRDYI